MFTNHWEVILVSDQAGKDIAEVNTLCSSREGLALSIVGYHRNRFSGLMLDEILKDAVILLRGEKLPLFIFVEALRVGSTLLELKDRDLTTTAVYQEVLDEWNTFLSSLDESEDFAAVIKAQHPQLFTLEMAAELERQQNQDLVELGLVDAGVRNADGS